MLHWRKEGLGRGNVVLARSVQHAGTFTDTTRTMCGHTRRLGGGSEGLGGRRGRATDWWRVWFGGTH